MAFSKHYDPTDVDPADLSPWERQQLEDARASTGGVDLAALQDQLDAITKLIAEAQRGVPPAAGSWYPVLARMIDRGAATAETIDGLAQTWHVLEDDEHAALRDRLERRGAGPAAVEELLDAAPAGRDA